MSKVDYRGANETRTLFGQVMWYVAATAGFFALGSYLGRGLSNGWGFLFFIVAFACMIGMQFALRSSSGLSVALLFGLGLSLGLALSPTWTITPAPTRKRCIRPARRPRCSSPDAARSATPPARTCLVSRVCASGRYWR
jgi:hypothetical protein